MQATRTIEHMGRTFVLTAHRFPEGDFCVSWAEQGGQHASGVGCKGNTADSALNATMKQFADAVARVEKQLAGATGAA